MQPSPPPTISQLMRAGNRFTDRNFMKLLGVGHPALKQLEANPGLISFEQFLVLAELLGQPAVWLVQLALAEIARNSAATDQT